MASMLFSELLFALESQGISVRKVLKNHLNPEISNVTSHSSKLYPQSLFCCVTGRTQDGHNYAPEVFSKGVTAFLCERELSLEAPQIIVENTRAYLGKISEIVYGFPSESLRLTGITGTNGKSSTAFILRSIIEAGGARSGLLGTIEYSDGVEKEEAGRTTPEASDLQRFFARMRDHGCSDCVMEVSSHAVIEKRIEGCSFSGLIFSNLTPEHLDYHGDMENYFQAKKHVFEAYTRKGWLGALNCDDLYGKRLYEEFSSHSTAYGLKEGYDKKIQLLSASFSSNSTEMEVLDPHNKPCRIRLPLVGKFNLYNALGAMTLASLYGIPWEQILQGLVEIPKIPGRMESYFTDRDFSCVIDYAHTPDALEKVLHSLRQCCRGSLRVLFGSGGNRFPGNRPLMGIAAAKYADAIVITMDNPRFEDPHVIAQENYKGVLEENPRIPCQVIVDRAEAIYNLLDSGEPKDILVIAGKGPETYLEIAGVRQPFSDKGTFHAWSRERGVSYR